MLVVAHKGEEWIHMNRILFILLLVLAADISTAASYDWNWCEGARDPKACLKKCKLKDDECQAQWLDNDAENAKRILENARASNEDYQEICARTFRARTCTLCPEKTRDCALQALELEANELAERAASKRQLNRISEMKANPGYTEKSLKRSDPRVPIDRRVHPEYNPIGIVSLPNATQSGFNRGTGWLTSDCLVVTARHVITGSEEKHERSAVGARVSFLVGNPPSDDKNFAYKTSGVVVEAGDGGMSISDDWALIKLDESLGKRVGNIATWQYSVEDAQTCTALEVAGYPGGKDVDQLWWQSNCPLEKHLSSEFQFILRCPATQGNSGGPLLCRETNGDLRAIGIIATQSFGANAQALNFSAHWWEAIKPAIQKHKGTCPND
ncbi:serine protease (plasmid) [Cupriavidus pinatubonensis]|uniref:trypsin-like serine peptidase n=1 Tax=Cupriavidus pinatubonensis TaxID=248026 RepID=UPI001C729F41|nr:trypsin-like serine protease [Cupriavidus pinatubonensis]QYY33659.1 serine protease [Cupriavidus pinatubonensis]